LIELVGFEDPALLGTWISIDRSSFRISVDCVEQNYASASNLFEALEAATTIALPNSWIIEASGTFPLAYDWVTEVQTTQQRSFPAAFVLVFAVVSLFFRSVILGLCSLIPALIPVVTILGVMGFAGMSLDVGKAMLAAIVLGIAVDDSIHLLFRYNQERRKGIGSAVAIREAVIQVGRPVITTSLALALGFLTLTLSAWGTISSFGFFVSIAMVAALVAALLVLPAIIVTFSRDRL
jgi:predicted RND superfamily exporter protein